MARSTLTLVAGAAAAAALYVLTRHLLRRKQKVLITGASGFLGQHLLNALANDSKYELHGTYNGNPSFVEDWGTSVRCHKLALNDARAMTALIDRVKPDVIVHLGAISSPVKAEGNPAFANAVNCPIAMLDALAADTSIVFLSTDQVYDGLHAPYTETDEAKPVNVYGQSKLDFERALQAKVPGRSISLRMSLLLGPPAPKRSTKKNSFLQDCDRMVGSGKTHEFFMDEFRSVVAVPDVMHVLKWAINGGAKTAPGVYNMGGPPMHGTSGPSRVDVAMAVAGHRGHSKAAISAIKRPPPAPGGVRSPPDISMDSSKLERAAGLRFRPLSDMLGSAFP